MICGCFSKHQSTCGKATPTPLSPLRIQRFAGSANKKTATPPSQNPRASNHRNKKQRNTPQRLSPPHEQSKQSKHHKHMRQVDLITPLTQHQQRRKTLAEPSTHSAKQQQSPARPPTANKLKNSPRSSQPQLVPLQRISQTKHNNRRPSQPVGPNSREPAPCQPHRRQAPKRDPIHPAQIRVFPPHLVRIERLHPRERTGCEEQAKQHRQQPSLA